MMLCDHVVLLKSRFMCLFLVIISSLKNRRNSSSCYTQSEMDRVPQQMAAQSMNIAIAKATKELSRQLQSCAQRTSNTLSTTQSAAQKRSEMVLLLRVVPFICLTRCWKVAQKLLQLVVRTGYMNVQVSQGGWASRSQSWGTEEMGKLRAEATSFAQVVASSVGRGRYNPARRQLGRIVNLAAVSISQGVCSKYAKALTLRTACMIRKTSWAARNSSNTNTVKQYFLFSNLSQVSLSQSNFIFRSWGCFTNENQTFVISSRFTISLNYFSKCHSDTCASTCLTTMPRPNTLRYSYSFQNLKNDSKVSLCCLSRRYNNTNNSIQATDSPLSKPTLKNRPFLAEPTSYDHFAKVSPNFLSYSLTSNSLFLETSLQYTALVGGMILTVLLLMASGGRSRRWRVAGTCVLKRQYLLSRMVSPRKVVQLTAWVNRYSQSSSKLPYENWPMQVLLGLKMLLRQIMAARLRRTTLSHLPDIAAPVDRTARISKMTSARKAVVRAMTQKKRVVWRWRVGLKAESGAAVFFSSFSLRFFR